jgi:hypothetical protein
VDKIRRAGYLIDRADMAAYAGKQGILYRQHIMHALADRGYTQTIHGPLYAKLFGPGGIAAAKGSSHASGPGKSRALGPLPERRKRFPRAVLGKTRFHRR